MTKRFTFAVCIACGVQSQPIIIDEAFDIYRALEKMNWEFAGYNNNVSGLCPSCREKKAVA